MNQAQIVKEQFEASNRGRKVTLQMLANQFQHVLSTGLGTKTYVFVQDGSRLRAQGRGKYFRLEAFERGQQAA